MRRGQKSNRNRSLEEEFLLTVLDDTEGFKASVREGTADVLEIARELGLGTKDVT